MIIYSDINNASRSPCGTIFIEQSLEKQAHRYEFSVVTSVVYNYFCPCDLSKLNKFVYNYISSFVISNPGIRSR